MDEVIVRSELGDIESFFIPPDFATNAKLEPIVYGVSEILGHAITVGTRALIINQVQVCYGHELLRNLPGRGDIVQITPVVVIMRSFRACMGYGENCQVSVQQVQAEAPFECNGLVVVIKARIHPTVNTRIDIQPLSRVQNGLSTRVIERNSKIKNIAV